MKFLSQIQDKCLFATNATVLFSRSMTDHNYHRIVGSVKEALGDTVSSESDLGTTLQLTKQNRQEKQHGLQPRVVAMDGRVKHRE